MQCSTLCHGDINEEMILKMRCLGTPFKETVRQSVWDWPSDLRARVLVHASTWTHQVTLPLESKKAHRIARYEACVQRASTFASENPSTEPLHASPEPVD